MIDLISYLYSALCLTGGLIGFFKANSIPSLIAGIVVFSIIVTGTLLKEKTDNYIIGMVLQILAALAMCGKMGPSYWGEDGKIFPHLTFAIVSILYGGYVLIAYYKYRKESGTLVPTEEQDEG